MSLLVLLVALLVAVWGYMTAWFVIARMLDRTDAVDSAWGLGFVYLAWLAYIIDGHHSIQKLLAGLLVTIWGARLFLHLTNRNMKKSEDRRYVIYRQKWGSQFWQRAYVRIFLVQAVLLWTISLTSIAIMAADTRWQWLAIIGFVVWAGGIVFEAIADWQLGQFMKTRQPGEIMMTGLWHYSRHPNYFGEITVWSGAALVAMSAAQWWGIIGALVITVLITRVSGIPPLEKHYQGNKQFQKYKQRTSVLVPLPPRN